MHTVGRTARGASTAPGSLPVRRLLALLAASLGAVLLAVGESRAQDAGAVVVVAPIQGEIDLGLAPFLARVLDEAEADGAAAVLLEIDTPGGRLDAVLEMRRSLLDSPVRSIAFVDATALSAGALTAIAATEIHTVPGGVMGAATPVDGATGATADAKVISAVRSIFRATAQERDRDPRIAEAMVDPDVEVEGVVAAGELLTLDDRQMLELGYADGTARRPRRPARPARARRLELVEEAPSLAERLVRFLTGALIAPLLLSVGIWLLVGDLLSGGVGIGAVGRGGAARGVLLRASARRPVRLGGPDPDRGGDRAAAGGDLRPPRGRDRRRAGAALPARRRRARHGQPRPRPRPTGSCSRWPDGSR
jgi:membrane-bound serine protease (ClpP class)